MKAATMNGLIIGIAVAAIIGWIFALVGFDPSQFFRVNQASAARLAYGFYNVGNNVPCMTKIASDSYSIQTYVENERSPEAAIEFTLLAGHADISFDSSTGFGSSIIKTIGVPEGTNESYNQTLYVRPYSTSEDLSLKLDAKVVTPNNAILVYSLTSPHSNTVIFYKDATGNYCPKS